MDYIAKRAAQVTVDGRLDEPDWNRAQHSPNFSDLVTGRPGWYDSRAAILWDDDCLYVAFWVQEPDIRAHIRRRDDTVYRDNDVELFIDGGDAYYELEINAAGTLYEALWVWDDAMESGAFAGFNPGGRTMKLDGIGAHKHPRGMRTGFLDWDLPGLRAEVAVDGAINDRAKPDKGWTVELAIPWSGLALLANGRSLPPKEGDVWRLDCSRFQQYAADGEKLPPYRPAGWAWKAHGAFDSHMPERFPVIGFSIEPVSRAKP